MLKRYDLGQIRLGGQGNETIYGPGIVERENGDYVQYEDYMQIIDAIGAGGVKGQLMRKELDEHRVEFELWMSDDGRYPRTVNKNLSGRYTLAVAESAWETWKAARSITE